MAEPAAVGNIEEPNVKKLLVLDVNGLLVATYHKAQKMPEEPHHAKLGNFFVYKRPACEEFLEYCFKYFVVGVWSSAREHNVNLLVDFVFKDLKPGLAFSWHQRHCTTTTVMHPDNNKKPIFLKELSKLWTKVDPGKYGPSNSLLIDDSPYKALKNPPHTGIFPRSYNGDEVDDNFLTVLRSYLEGLREATSVQTYVQAHPIGEPSITMENPLWDYFSCIVNGSLLELDPAATNKVVNEVADAVGSFQQSHEHLNEVKPEAIEWEDMDRSGKRRRLSPAGVAAHSSRSRIHASQNQSRQSQDGRIQPLRHQERERQRSPRMPVNHREKRKHSEWISPEYSVYPQSSYTGEQHSRRDIVSRGGQQDRRGFLDTSLSRGAFGQRRNELDTGRAWPSAGGRQIFTPGIPARDLPQFPILSEQEARGILPPPILPARFWDSVEQPAPLYDSVGIRRQFTNVAPSLRTQYDRRWENSVRSGRRSSEYDRRWEEPVSSGRDKGYERDWDRPVRSGYGNDSDKWWDEPSGQDSYGRKWDKQPGTKARREYESRWQEPAVHYDRRSERSNKWAEPVHTEDRRNYDSRWEEPINASRSGEYDSEWSSIHPFQYVAAPPRIGSINQWLRNPSIDERRSHPSADRHLPVGPRGDNLPHYWSATNRHHR